MTGRSISFTVVIFILLFSPALGQNLEAGFHGGIAALGSPDHVPHDTEKGVQYGVWLIFWPGDYLSVAADWAIVPEDDFMTFIDGFSVGEESRNRQYVDITLQYHFWRTRNHSGFAEIGGGTHWNNRNVLNPDGATEFEEPGKESSRFAVWTLGVGFRQRLLSHLNWISQIKLHNPGLQDRYGFRVLTGVTVSWK